MANSVTASLQFLGAAGGVTGSKFLFSFGDEQLLIDCGLFQGLKELRQRNWAPVPIGSDPAKRGDPNACAHRSFRLSSADRFPGLQGSGVRYAWNLRSLAGDAAGCGASAGRGSALRESEGLFQTLAGVAALYRRRRRAFLQLLRPMRVRESIEVIKGVFLDFGRVGHILGAGSARLWFQVNGQKRTLLDSGDLGRYDRPILKDPEPAGSADWLLIESTYGNRLHAKDSELELRNVIRETSERRGCLVIPAFAIGRTQDLLYTIRKMEDDGEIPAIPVHVDSPMGLEATEIYGRHIEEHNFEMAKLLDQERCPISSRHMVIDKTPEQSKSINSLKGPLIIISASGMVTGGRVLHHLKHRLPNSDTTVLLAGYQAEGTRGRLLQDGAKEVKLLGEVVPVRAKIKVLDGFSAHADQGEILRWLGTFKKAPRTTYIVHGEPPAASALADVIRERLKWKVEIAKYQQRVTLA